ncbi:hypothetical protein Prudu_004329 [Prunus dulcis]|uniref:Galactose oxidase/kelch repeat superfamily protein n=1 Tax=Prunus dulcis TaxID=3755 RepID=A0A4Y1QV42_PRUDU|nr:hypothetical protein Prudu_004329 [Prunus dulcis]
MDDMPIGMGEGWPARQAGTKLSVVVDGELYAFDPSSSLDSGKIKVYDQGEDAWKVVIGKVPIHDFAGSESPYLLAGFHGKLHVITKDVNHEITVLRADLCSNLGLCHQAHLLSYLAPHLIILTQWQNQMQLCGRPLALGILGQLNWLVVKSLTFSIWLRIHVIQWAL